MSDSRVDTPFLLKPAPSLDPCRDFWAELHDCGCMDKKCAEITRVWSILGVAVSACTFVSFAFFAHSPETSLKPLVDFYGQAVLKVSLLCASGNGFFTTITLIAMTRQVQRQSSMLRRGALAEYNFQEGRANPMTDSPQFYIDLTGVLIRIPLSFAGACVLGQVWNGPPLLFWFALASISVGFNMSQPIFMNMVDLQTDLSNARIKKIIKNIKDFQFNKKDEHYWAKLNDRYREMRVFVVQLWDESTFFNAAYNATFIYCAFITALTTYACLQKQDLRDGILGVLLCFLLLVGVGGNLKSMASVSALCTATTVNGKTGEDNKSIPNAAMMFVGIEGKDMSERQKLDHANFMTTFSLYPTGARMLVTIDQSLIIKVAAPLISALASAFTYALTMIGQKPFGG